MSPEKRAIHSHCAQCMAKYKDKERDCERPHCPLYAFMPYRKVQERECIEQAS